MNMFSRFARAPITSGVAVLLLLVFGGDCVFAQKPIAPASNEQTRLPTLLKAAQGDVSVAAPVPAIKTQTQTKTAMGSSCEDQQNQLEAILEKGSEGSGLEELKNFSRTVTCERLGPLVVAAIDRFNAD